MATLSDSFTGSYAAFWSEWEKTAANTAIAIVSDQLEITASGGSGYGPDAGLVTDSTYDISEPGNVNVDVITNELGAFICVCLTKIAATNEDLYDDQANWYRGGVYLGTFYFQKKVSGTPTTIYSAGSGTTGNYELDFPSTGNDVRFKVDTTEKSSEATYALSSRDVYFVIEADTNDSYGYDLFQFDNFSATYTAAGGGTTVLKLAGDGGLAGPGGLAGRHGGLAG